jgi:5-methylcytosine-specific restriction enzyme A
VQRPQEKNRRLNFMATITLTQIKAAFTLAESVYGGKLTFETAAAELRDKHGLNLNSARDFIGQYRHMLNGEVFKRSLSAAALEYFLPTIEYNSGREAADNAISAAWKHIAYYEALEDTRLVKLRAVVVKFQSSLPGPSTSQVLESCFAADVVQAARDSSTARKKRLEDANTAPAFIFARIKVYARNPDVVVEVLARASGNCELCKKPAPFLRKTDGTPYLEVHHRNLLAHGGKDSVENAIAVCPNCHRQQHHGET